MKEKTMTTQTTSPASSNAVFLIAKVLPLSVLQSLHQFFKKALSAKASVPDRDYFNDELANAATRRQAVRESRLAQLSSQNETLAAAPEVAKGFSKNGVYHFFDRDMFINIGLHSEQAGINAAYTTAVERLMLSAFGDVTGQHLSSLATASAAPTEWREPLKQLGQLRLEAYALLHEEYLSMNPSLAERL
jgi:hypothetical protein